jgi:hypothetical protein
MNPFNLTLGYILFNVVQQGVTGPLDIYGSTMRIEQLGKNNQLNIADILCLPTKMTADIFNSDTIFPHGNTDPHAGSSLKEEWMHANTPPPPPVCVPNDYASCPPPSSQAQSKSAKRQERAR